MIFDYSKYISSVGHKGIVNYKAVDTDAEFFTHEAVCPFCKKTITNTVYEQIDSSHDEWLYGSFVQSEKVVQCPICGWWEYKYTNQSDAIIDGIRANDIIRHTAVLETYNDSDADIPIALLRSYVEKNPDKIYGIDPHKMAELVRVVFADFYPDCKVIPFGKTRDGGKDGLLIDANGNHRIIQVKRRSSPDKTEGIAPIRELLGVAGLEDYKTGCIFVSTADHFSADAKRDAQKAVQKNLVDCFDLYDCKSFLELVNLTRSDHPDVWQDLLQLKQLGTRKTKED